MKILAVAALAACIALPAVAQQNCGPTESLPAALANNFGERIIYIAAMDDGKVLTMFVNDQTQSWTLAISDGPMSCIVASGTGVNMVPTGVSL